MVLGAERGNVSITVGNRGAPLVPSQSLRPRRPGRARWWASGLALGALLVFGSLTGALAQAGGGKSLTLIINYGAGGNVDIEGRVFALHTGERIVVPDGGPFVVRETASRDRVAAQP